jgi:hypothetical protein
MLPVADIVGLTESLVALSARSVVPEIVVSRAGAPGFVA